MPLPDVSDDLSDWENVQMDDWVDRLEAAGERVHRAIKGKRPHPLKQVVPDMFVLWCEQNGLGTPTPEYRFCERRWRFDYAFVEDRIAVEVEGGIWIKGRHSRGKGFLADIQKYNRAATMGWIVIRTTPDSLVSAETLDWLRAAQQMRAA